MTAANVFVPKSSDARLAESRAQEPSMEDILASIRRIIADDQVQASRPGYGGPRRVAPSPGAGTQALERGSDDRAEVSSDGPASRYDDVGDLPRSGGAESLASAPASYGGRPTIVEEAPIATLVPPKTSASPNADLLAADEADEHFEEPASYSNGHARSAVAEAAYAESSDAEPGPEAEHDLWVNDARPVPVASSEDSGLGEELMSPALGASVMSAFETLAATVVLQNTEMLERIMRELLRPLVKSWLDENLPTLVERLVRHEIERVARGGR